MNRPSTFEQLVEVSRRSVIRTVRQPAQFIPPLIFPLFLLAVNSAGLDAATHIPGFPTDSYLTFALAVPFMQTAIFSLLNGGTDLARDIESGFLNRVALTPVSRMALLAGELFGIVLMGTIFSGVFLLVGLAAGADFAAGLAGVPLLFALVIVITTGFGCIGLAAGARTGNSEAVQGLFPLFFMFLFFSSMAMPRDLIEKDWFRTVATINPVSYLIEGIRSLFIDGIEVHELLIAFAIGGGLILVFLTISARLITTRLIAR